MPRPLSLVRCLVPALALAAAAAGEPTVTVREVAVEGTRTWSSERVRFLLQVRPGKTFTMSGLQQATADDMKAIERMGPFFDNRVVIQPTEQGDEFIVTYRLQEQPTVSAVRFRGIGYFKREKAEKLIQTRTGGHLNPLIVENDRHALEARFRDEGARYATVAVETRDVDGLVEVTFAVDLGTEIEVAQVDWIGLPPGARPRRIQQGLINLPGQPYLPEQVQLDEWAAVRNLQDLGWLDARLTETRREVFDYVRPTEDRRRHGPAIVPDGAYNDRVTLVYTVVPGARYRLGRVSFVGSQVASQEALRSAFAMAEGDWFTREALYGDGRPGGDVGAIERARRVVSNQGYARCEARVDRVIDPERQVVDLVITIVDGREYRVGRVDVAGNRQTRDAVARRALFLGPGDRWNDDRLDESRLQLQRTGLFKDSPARPLRIEKSFPEDRPEEVDLQVRLNEDSTAQFRFEVSYSSAVGVGGAVEFSERNFDLLGVLTGRAWRGAGQNLSINLQATERTRVGSVNWGTPYVFDGPFSFSTNNSYSQSTLREWDERRITTTETVGRRFLRNRLHLGFNYGYSDIKVDNVEDDAADDALEGSYFQNTSGVFASYDQLRPSRVNPTSGYAIDLNHTIAGAWLPATTSYSDSTSRGVGYLPVFRFDDGGVTYFSLASRWRELHAREEGDSVPFYQRIRGGGPSPRHRGFDVNRLGPRKENAEGNLAYWGGNKEFLATLEFSVPVQGTNEGVRLLAFCDYGNVWGEGDEPEVGDLRTAVGFGVRFPIQLPVALDFAFLLDRERGEAATQVHFGLGQVRF